MGRGGEGGRRCVLKKARQKQKGKCCKTKKKKKKKKGKDLSSLPAEKGEEVKRDVENSQLGNSIKVKNFWGIPQ